MPATDEPDAVAQTPSWDDFKEVSERWTLPLSEFTYALQYVPVSLSSDQRSSALSHIADCVVAALRVEPECELTSLRVSASHDASIEAGDTGEPSYFTISFLNPVFDFALQMGPTTLQITKMRTTLRNLILTTRILTRVTQQLFPAPVDTPAATVASDFRQRTSIALQPVRLNFRWLYALALGARLSDSQEEATNLSLLAKLTRLEMPPGASPQDYPLAGLEMDTVQRGDVSIGFTKVINERRRLAWIDYQGPWNITRKDVDLGFTYQVGPNNAPMEPHDFGDFWTPFVAFYRDEILRKFMGHLFGDMTVTVRP